MYIPSHCTRIPAIIWWESCISTARTTSFMKSFTQASRHCIQIHVCECWNVIFTLTFLALLVHNHTIIGCKNHKCQVGWPPGMLLLPSLESMIFAWHFCNQTFAKNLYFLIKCTTFCFHNSFTWISVWLFQSPNSQPVLCVNYLKSETFRHKKSFCFSDSSNDLFMYRIRLPLEKPLRAIQTTVVAGAQQQQQRLLWPWKNLRNFGVGQANNKHQILI